MAKVTCFTVHFGIPAGAARVRQHCRGCAHVGRCGPQTVRPGQKADGETRYFQKEGCSVLEREAWSIFAPAYTIEEVRNRVAGSTLICGKSGTSAFEGANTIEDSRWSGAVARKRCDPGKRKTNTIEDLEAKVAKVTCFLVHFRIPAGAARIRGAGARIRKKAQSGYSQR